MSTQPNRPDQIEEIDEDLKRVLDERVAAAKKDPAHVSREDLLRNGLQKLKRRVPR